jgi:hypothetical protein
MGVGSAGISLLLIDPARLPGLPARLVLRDENRDKTDKDLFRSLLTTLALSEPALPNSRSVAMSINAWGKIPVLPFAFVPDQHQNS